MYDLKLVYDPEPRTQTLKESVTFCAGLELYTHLGIHCTQASATVLRFRSSKDCLLASLYLSSSGSFTPKML